MRIVRFEEDSKAAYGVLEGKTIDVLQGTPFGEITRAGRAVELDDVKLLAPVEPPNIMALGLNYKQHAIESKMEMPDHPLMFIKASTALNGPGEPIVLPRVAPSEVDYEAEFCIVIGRRAKHVPEADALDYCLGYTCGNDVSARDVQLRLDGQWARGKSFDTFCPLGPWIETDLDPDNAAIRLRLNGRVMQESNTSDLIFNCSRIVSFLSDCMTLQPGTVIMTGTPSGVGFARKPQVFLKPGDTVEVEIDGIGTLVNPVEAEQH